MRPLESGPRQPGGLALMDKVYLGLVAGAALLALGLASVGIGLPLNTLVFVGFLVLALLVRGGQYLLRRQWGWGVLLLLGALVFGGVLAWLSIRASADYARNWTAANGRPFIDFS